MNTRDRLRLYAAAAVWCFTLFEVLPAFAAPPDLTNVAYAYTPLGEPIWLDIYLPKTGSGAFPVVIYIHGGSWQSGNKSQVPAFILDRGFVVASINYRLTKGGVAGNSTAAAHWPAQLEDVKAAVRYVRSLGESRSASVAS